MEPLWNIEDLDLLASDLDTSLSGLGGSTTTTFDMRDHFSLTSSFDKSLNKEKARSEQNLSSWNFSLSNVTSKPAKVVKKPCRKHDGELNKGENCMSEEAYLTDALAIEGNSYPNIISAPTLSRSLSQCSLQPGFTMKEPHFVKSDFQYVLAAATALGTKVGEETLTYLNQGQPYEIRLKKLHGISEMKGKLLKSVLHVGFQERRLQFREKLEIFAWQSQRPSERILDIDLSLSYGIFDVIPDSKNINCCEFMWDPTREASVFLKINCISTEFTCKRRGGEKGVPFRILIETYSHWEDPPRKLDAASCLVKVFKSKGADRKHKTDREKYEKLPQAEQRDLQPSYQCTVFTPSTIKVENIPFQDFSESLSPQSLNSSFDVKPESPVISASEVTTSTPSVTSSPQNGPEQKDKSEADDSGIVIHQAQGDEIYITAKTSTAELHNWLIKNKFSKYLSCFALYSAKDLLCLSRADIVDICGAADGIRLYNCLHIRHPPPLRKFYISKDKLRFHGLYLDSLTCYEVKEQLCKIYRLPSGAVGEIYVTGPEGILLIMTDKVLQNMKDESTYISDVLKAEENENYTIILKSYKNIPHQET